MSIKTTDEGLKRVVGIPGLSLNIINFTIGAGIFVLPAIVGIELGSFAIFGYLFCGVIPKRHINWNCFFLCAGI